MMSFEFPANVERDIEVYAHAKHISASEAVVQLVQDALKAKKPKSKRNEITEAELEELRTIPTFAFFEKLPLETVECMEAASSEIRAERFRPRG